MKLSIVEISKLEGTYVPRCYDKPKTPAMVEYIQGKRKLTDADAAKIRADDRSGGLIAHEYGVSRSLVSNIKCGRRRNNQQ